MKKGLCRIYYKIEEIRKINHKKKQIFVFIQVVIEKMNMIKKKTYNFSYYPITKMTLVKLNHWETTFSFSSSLYFFSIFIS